MSTSNELAKSPKEPNLFREGERAREREGQGKREVEAEQVTRKRSVNVLSDLFMLSSCV